MNLKMWSLFNFQEIFTSLKKIKSSDSKLTLWQHSTQHLFQFEGKFTQVSEDRCIILFTKKWEAGSLKTDEAIYVHCPGLDIIFKRETFNFDTGELTFKTPSELMLREKRRIERFRFRYQDFKNVSFELDKTNEKGEPIKRNYNLIDLSTAGLGFVGPAEEIQELEVGDKIFVTHITDQSIETKCEANVCSVEQYQVKLGSRERTNVHEVYRVGVEFKEAIESVSFKSVKSIVERTQKRTKGLEIDGFNGLSDTEQTRVIKKVGEENPVLANQISEHCENLDRLRYLTSEMKQKFWLEVNQDLLATALRLTTKELIYDLLIDVSDRMREEFLYKLDSPKSPSAIEKAQRTIVDWVFQKEKEGVFVLSPQSFVQYV